MAVKRAEKELSTLLEGGDAGTQRRKRNKTGKSDAKAHPVNPVEKTTHDHHSST